MQPHTRAMIAASAHAFVIGRKVAGLYDHQAGRHLRIAAETRGERLLGVDGDRRAGFGGTLPNIYDNVDHAYVTVEVAGTTVRGFDHGASGFYTAEVGDRAVQLYDHEAAAWFSYDVQVA